MDIPPPDPAVLLSTWMEWEKGDALPGKVLADLKRAGMRQLLDSLAAAKDAGIDIAPAAGGGKE